MKTSLRIILFLGLLLAGLVSCMKYEADEEELFEPIGEGLFIVNEGNFLAGTASLSYYDPGERSVENEVFYRANAMKLGDVGQSMVIQGDRGYIAVNHSGVVFVIEVDTFRVVGMIPGLTSPRYIHIVSETKGYITDLYAARITIFNPETCQITGYIETPGHPSTEQMVQQGKYVFTNCWSYDNTILVIDTERDEVVESIKVGLQPVSMVMDKNDKIWVMTDGGYEDNPYGWEEPTLCRIDAATRQIEQCFRFDRADSPGALCLNGAGDVLYFLNESVWRMEITADQLPLRPLIPAGLLYYGLAIDPRTSEVYVADAIDYQQPGMIYRYTADGALSDSFRVGIIPGAFCFKERGDGQ